MTNIYRTYVIPIILGMLSMAMILVCQSVIKDSYLAQVPYDSLLLVTVIYSVFTVIRLPKDLPERKFWIIIMYAFSIYLLGSVLRTYIWKYVHVGVMIVDATQLLYVLAIILLITGIFALIKLLGIKISRNSRKKIYLMYIIVFITLISIFFPFVIGTDTNIMSIVTYIIIAAFCTVSISLSIIMYRYTKSGSLKIPFLFMSLSVCALVLLQIATVIILTLGSKMPNLHPFVYTPYVLCMVFAMMSMSSRVDIARKQDVYLES